MKKREWRNVIRERRKKKKKKIQARFRRRRRKKRGKKTSLSFLSFSLPAPLSSALLVRLRVHTSGAAAHKHALSGTGNCWESSTEGERRRSSNQKLAPSIVAVEKGRRPIAYHQSSVRKRLSLAPFSHSISLQNNPPPHRRRYRPPNHDLLEGSPVPDQGRVRPESGDADEGSGAECSSCCLDLLLSPLARLRRRRGAFGRQARRAGRDGPGHAVGRRGKGKARRHPGSRL